jgi:methyl-accepting chemotaxis protein
VVTLVAGVQVWRLKGPLTEQFVTTLGLMEKTLGTTSDALGIATQSLEAASEGLATLATTTDAMGETVKGVQRPLADTTTFLRNDMPTTLRAVRASVRTAQEAAGFVEGVIFTVCSTLPFRLNCGGEASLSIALSGVALTLESLPGQLTTMGANLAETQTSITQAADHMTRLGRAIRDINRQLTSVEAVITDYHGQIGEYQALLRRARGAALTAADVVAWGLTFLLFWLGLFQITILARGIAWLRAAR